MKSVCSICTPGDINIRTSHIEICRRGAEQKCHRLAVNSIHVVTGMELQSHYHIVDKVDTYKYLKHMLFFDDSDWPTIFNDLQRLQRIWVRLYRLLGREEVDRTSGRFYVVVVQSVLFFRTNLWIITPCILWVLGSMNN